MPPERTNNLPHLAYRRIVVKAGTNVLTGRTDSLNAGVLRSLVQQIAQVRRLGAQALFVTSGAIAAGREVLRERGSNVVERQVLAAVGQSRLMHTYQEMFAAEGAVTAQALLTHRDVQERHGYLNVRNTLEGLLAHHVVPIVNENDVVETEEIGQVRLGDNDTLSALVANLVDADLLLMLTDSGGLYTADPYDNPDAQLIPRVEVIDAGMRSLAQPTPGSIGRGGMLSKLLAAERATAAGIPVVVAGYTADIVERAARGEPVGTHFPTSVTALESRKRWLLSGLAESGGEIVVDTGAVTALRSRHGSLLPAGVRAVRGRFDRGDIVSIVSEAGERVACGIASYGTDDLEAIRGVRSDEIERRLGHHFGDEAMHRNNMVVL